jgi:hypothetical protein
MIFVDEVTHKEVKMWEEFAYKNNHGNIEVVAANKGDLSVALLEADEHLREPLSRIFYEDIPKLILALQAAYDFKFKGDDDGQACFNRD